MTMRESVVQTRTESLQSGGSFSGSDVSRSIVGGCEAEDINGRGPEAGDFQLDELLVRHRGEQCVAGDIAELGSHGRDVERVEVVARGARPDQQIVCVPDGDQHAMYVNLSLKRPLRLDPGRPGRSETVYGTQAEE
jgi:hypothetical protein